MEKILISIENCKCCVWWYKPLIGQKVLAVRVEKTHFNYNGGFLVKYEDLTQQQKELTPGLNSWLISGFIETSDAIEI